MRARDARLRRMVVETANRRLQMWCVAPSKAGRCGAAPSHACPSSHADDDWMMPYSSYDCAWGPIMGGQRPEGYRNIDMNFPHT